jgi:hypothetical protein
MNGNGYLHHPSFIGILAVQLYISSLYVEQSPLGTYDIDYLDLQIKKNILLYLLFKDLEVQTTISLFHIH